MCLDLVCFILLLTKPCSRCCEVDVVSNSGFFRAKYNDYGEFETDEVLACKAFHAAKINLCSVFNLV